MPPVTAGYDLLPRGRVPGPTNAGVAHIDRRSETPGRLVLL